MLLSSCTSTTSGGVVGVNRPQFLAGSASQYEVEAAMAHRKLVNAAASKNALVRGAEADKVKNIALRLINQVGVFRQDARNWNWQIELINSNEKKCLLYAGRKNRSFNWLNQRLKS